MVNFWVLSLPKDYNILDIVKDNFLDIVYKIIYYLQFQLCKVCDQNYFQVFVLN